MHKVLVFPRGTNPYQDLLYRRPALRDQFAIRYLDINRYTFPLLPLLLLLQRMRGVRVFHIHWPSFAITMPVPFRRHLSYWFVRLCLWSIAASGMRVVWTVHNITPHNTETADDLDIARRLSRLAATKIVHSTSTISEMERLGLQTEGCVMIPHGNYDEVYPNVVSRQDARAFLDIPGDARVITFFGNVQPYKNVPAIIDAYVALRQQYPNLYLLIAGKHNDPAVKQRVQGLDAAAAQGIKLYDRFIADDEVQHFFNAADVTAFPFTDITTSGSVLLAATFGKPIVAPYIGALTDIPTEVGVLYDHADPAGLRKGIATILDDDTARAAMAAAAKRYAATLAWQHIATQTAAVYDRVINRRT